MTHYYRYIDSNTLLKDRKLIIFAESIKYCREKEVDRIRYTELKVLCNDKLAHLTEGKETDLGGNFEKLLKEIANPINPKNEQFMNRDHISRKKTYLHPNIPLMLSYLDKNRMNPDPVMNYTTEHRGIKENPIEIRERLEVKVIRGKK